LILTDLEKELSQKIK